ncbi:hypothetical protein GCM10023067_04810 [Aminobacter aganoensis]
MKWGDASEKAFAAVVSRFVIRRWTWSVYVFAGQPMNVDWPAWLIGELNVDLSVAGGVSVIRPYQAVITHIG